LGKQHQTEKSHHLFAVVGAVGANDIQKLATVVLQEIRIRDDIINEVQNEIGSALVEASVAASSIT